MQKKLFVFLLGCLFALVLLESSLRIIGFVYLNNKHPKATVRLTSKHTCTILCIGESTTYAGGEFSYPNLLQQILDRNNNGFEFKVINAGVSGTNSSAIIARLQGYIDEYKPDIVVVMMGANDSNVLAGRSQIIPNLKSIQLFRILFFQALDWGVETAGNVLIFGKPKYLIMGDYFLMRSRCYDAEKYYKKYIAMYPEDPHGYNALAFLYKFHSNDLLKAEQMFIQAINKGISEPRSYRALGGVYLIKENYAGAQAMFELAVKKEPRNWVNYFGLGRAVYMQGKFKEAEDYFSKTIEINPNNSQVYSDIGEFYFLVGKINEFVAACDTAIKNDSHLFKPYYLLGRHYYKEGRLKDAESVYRNFLSRNSENEICLGALVRIYAETGDKILLEHYESKLNKLRQRNLSTLTARNFQTLQHILNERKINLVCVQYPLRKLADLMLNFVDMTNVVFVDNEKNFKDAVDKNGFDYYFIDAWGGDTGHCSPEGNKLLAENIASAIINNYFSGGEKS